MGNNRFVPTMKFGVLSDMVGIKDKTLNKLSKQQVKESFQLFTLFCFLLLHILSESFLSMFRVRIGSSFYLPTRKW